MLCLILINFIVIIQLHGSYCQYIDQKVVFLGDRYSFDCKQDESVYFAYDLDVWSEIQENSDGYINFNLKYDYLNKNILRVTIDPIQSQNTGYYGCKKSTPGTKAINTIYHLVLAEVQTFYWTYICHGSVGSCVRSDDVTDENLSTFEVAEQTKVDLFCCASVTGYKDVTMNMNIIGEIRGKVDVKQRQEPDGSLVVCANQHTTLKRVSSTKQQTLKCDLIVDKEIHSSLSSAIVIKNRIPDDSDPDSPYIYTTSSTDNSNNDDDNDYFNNRSPSNGAKRRGFMTGKQIAIIVACIFISLLFCGLLFILIFFLCRKTKVMKKNSSKTNKSTEYSVVNTNEKITERPTDNSQDGESYYIEPTPLYENSPVFYRL